MAIESHPAMQSIQPAERENRIEEGGVQGLWALKQPDKSKNTKSKSCITREL